MAKKPPYFNFYPKDFAADDAVEAMSTMAVGAYILLLCKAWHQKPPASLPNDDRLLARYARLTPDDWQLVKDEVLAAFTAGNDSRLHQKRLRLEYDIFLEKSKKGQKAAYTRWGKCERNADAMQTHSERNAIQNQNQSQIEPKGSTSGDAARPRAPAAGIRWSTSAIGGWMGITAEHRRQWSEAFPACDLDRQLKAMDVWLQANPAKAKKSNWNRFIVNWLTKEQDRGGDAKSNRPGPDNRSRVRAEPGAYANVGESVDSDPA